MLNLGSPTLISIFLSLIRQVNTMRYRPRLIAVDILYETESTANAFYKSTQSLLLRDGDLTVPSSTQSKEHKGFHLNPHAHLLLITTSPIFALEHPLVARDRAG